MGLSEIRGFLIQATTLQDKVDNVGLENSAVKCRTNLEKMWNEMYGSPEVLRRLFPSSHEKHQSFWISDCEELGENFVKYKFPFSSVEDFIYLTKGESIKISFYLSAILYLSFIAASAFKYHR